MKQALLAGINNYPGTANDLQGCLNDVADWQKLLTQFGFRFTVLKDSAVTRANVKDSLQAIIAASQPGDVLIFQYSGHGTSVIDYSGDEIDHYDEALYLHDGVFLDDELRAIFKDIPEGVQMIVILDSCFSGTATRVIADENAQRRFFPYDQIDEVTPDMKKNKAFLVAEDMKEILISGCGDNEYCYDAVINGRANGAFTRYAINAIQGYFNYYEFMSELRQRLPSRDYPQTPQLECSVDNAYRKLFGSAIDTGVDDPGEPAEPPDSAKPSWWQRNWKKVVWGVIIVALIILSIKYL